jgi:1,4-dihydroxy-2-naphthoate octaprenyltransferase
LISVKRFGAALPILDAMPQEIDLPLHTLVRMTRPGFLIITVVGCVLGIASAAACGHPPNGWTALSTVVLAAMAHAVGNVLNDVHDALNGADVANTQGIFPFTGGTRLIQQGRVSVQQTRDLAYALLLVLIPAGSLLAVVTSPAVLWIGTLGMLLAWAYSAPPLKLMSRSLGELVVAAVWSLVVIGADTVQRGSVFIVPVWTSLSYGLLIANVLLINGVPDATADAAAGKATLAVRAGARGAAMIYGLLATLAHSWLAWGVWHFLQPERAIWGLLSAPFSAVAWLILWRRADTPAQLRSALVLTIMAACMHGLGMAGGLLSMHWI